jgi:hypothetical protein
LIVPVVKADMEDVLVRLKQETAVKEFLTAKVRVYGVTGVEDYTCHKFTKDVLVCMGL